MKLHYRIGRLLALVLAKTLWGIRVTGRDHVPTEGPVIVASNHASNWDPLLVGLACPREVHFLAKRELFSNPVFAALIRAYNAIPLDRGGMDRGALRAARGVLTRGDALLMFPEGTRSRDGRLGAPMPGVAFLASSAGAAIVPARIVGSNDTRSAFRDRGSLRVAFGAPLVHEGPASTDAYAATAARVMAAIAELATEVS